MTASNSMKKKAGRPKGGKKAKGGIARPDSANIKSFLGPMPLGNSVVKGKAKKKG